MSDPLGQLHLRFAGLQVDRDTGRARVYTGREFTGGPVTVVVLSAAAAPDPQVRRVFAEAVAQHSVAVSERPALVHVSDIHADQPWAALRGHPGTARVDRVVRELVGESGSGNAAALPSDPTFASGPLGSGPGIGTVRVRTAAPGPPAAADPAGQWDVSAPVGEPSTGPVVAATPASEGGAPTGPVPAAGGATGHTEHPATVLIAAVVIGVFLLAVACGVLNEFADPFGPNHFPPFPEP